LVNALIKLSPRTNKALNLVKVMYDLNDKGEAIEHIVDIYLQKNKDISKHIDSLDSKKIMLILHRNKQKIKSFGVKKLGLFGSYLSGEQKRNSDIDLLVEFNNLNFNNYMELKFYLENLFNKKVDLVMKSALKKRMEYVKGDALYVQGL
jgi:uncharacterized protein